MGKGNRVRLEKARQIASNESAFGAQKQKKQTPAWVGTLAVVLVIVLLLGCVALSVISDGGYTLRWTTVAESENFSVTGTMLSYYFYQNYSYFMNTYGTMASYMGLDTSISLKDQVAMGDTEGKTWFDYFMEPALEEIKTMLVYCEEARARNIKLEDADYEEIDSAIEVIKEQAYEYGYSPAGFFSILYGTGVKEKDVRRALELSQLAAKCQEVVQDDFVAALTDTEINTYYDENAGDFQTASVVTYSFSATEGDDAEKFAQDKADALAKANELAACKTEAEFIEYVLKYRAEISYDSFYSEEAEDFDAALLPDEAALAARRTEIIDMAVANAISGEGTPETESTDEIEIMFSDVAIALTEELAMTADGLKNENFQWSEETESAKWVSDSARAAGDITVIETNSADDEDADEDTTNVYSASVYMIIEPMHRDETPTRNVGHILFTATTYETDAKALEKAEAVLAEIKAGTVSRESFEAIATENTEDSGVFYEDVMPGQMVTEFEDWLFDADRKDGDLDIVKTQYGYHIMYYMGENTDTPSWMAKVETAMVNERLESWFEESETAFSVTVDNEKINKINA